MIYRTGTVDVTHGSTTVLGNDTEFLKYVSTGNIFKIDDQRSFYVVESVVSNTELIISRAYSGSTVSETDYVINSDQTPNIGLPLINRNDPDAAETINVALQLIDDQAGGFLDFHSLKSVTYSGEGTFFINGDYHDDELAIGRALRFDDSDGDLVTYNWIENNKIWSFSINGTPISTTLSYENLMSGEETIEQFDILTNTTRDSYVFVESINTVSGEVTYSGEVKGNVVDWEDNDVVNVYGKTKGIGEASVVTSSSVTLIALDDIALTMGDFAVGDTLYNYHRGTTRTITLIDSNIVYTNSSSDTWEAADIVYTIEATIKTKLLNLTASIDDLYYGARSNIGDDAIKDSHIDWGLGANQVNASDIPGTIAGLSSSYVNDLMEEIYEYSYAHVNSGEDAHNGTAISFSDDGQVGESLTSTNITDAVNELKTRINFSSSIEGIVDEASTEYDFIDESFISYDGSFFSGEWWVRWNTGDNTGNVRRINTFTSSTGEFTIVSGEGLPFDYTPSEGDRFQLMYKENRIKTVSVTDESYTISGITYNTFIIDATNNNVTLLLPSASDIYNDDVFRFKRKDSSGNTVMLSGETIDGTGTTTLDPLDSLNIVSDYTEWWSV